MVVLSRGRTPTERRLADRLRRRFHGVDGPSGIGRNFTSCAGFGSLSGGDYPQMTKVAIWRRMRLVPIGYLVMKKLTSIFAVVAAFSVMASAAPEPVVMRHLFNGKDLAGWQGEGYVVEDGVLVCTEQGKVLHSDEVFANYILDFEFLLPAGGNNGLGIHYPGTGDASATGMELQILDNDHEKHADLKPEQYHGSLYLMAAARRGALKPTGEWNHQRVWVMGNSVRVDLNDETILRADLDDLQNKFPQHEGVKRRAGHIAWLGHGDRVKFRKIEIAELLPAANEAGAEAAGFTKLFDGKSLAGWKHTPETSNWRASQGILKHNGQSGEIGDLWSEKEYKDFTLVFDWRWTGRGPMKQQPVVMPDGSHNGTAEVEELDSGVYLRGSSKAQVNLWNWTCGSGEVYGYRMDQSLPAEVRAGVTPKAKADAPLGEWNRMMITVEGETLNVSLNGKVVIENAKLPDLPKSGPIALQTHGAPIDFANVWIKEL